MVNTHDKYIEIIKKCRFISKPGEWFESGSECKIVDNSVYCIYLSEMKFNQNDGLFEGINSETGRIDEESCPFDEFFIIDEYGNDISDMDLNEYKSYLRDKKLGELINEESL